MASPTIFKVNISWNALYFPITSKECLPIDDVERRSGVLKK